MYESVNQELRINDKQDTVLASSSEVKEISERQLKIEQLAKLEWSRQRNPNSEDKKT